jgi:hypothetical protein
MPFKKGQSGNAKGKPKGRTSIPTAIKTGRKHEVAYAIDRQMMADTKEFNEIRSNPKASMLDICISETIQEYIKNPSKNAKPMEMLIAHWIGRPKESLDLTSGGETMPTIIKIVAKDDIRD